MFKNDKMIAQSNLSLRVYLESPVVKNKHD